MPKRQAMSSKPYLGIPINIELMAWPLTFFKGLRW